MEPYQICGSSRETSLRFFGRVASASQVIPQAVSSRLMPLCGTVSGRTQHSENRALLLLPCPLHFACSWGTFRTSSSSRWLIFTGTCIFYLVSSLCVHVISSGTLVNGWPAMAGRARSPAMAGGVRNRSSPWKRRRLQWSMRARKERLCLLHISTCLAGLDK
jgi:hypothetical protein